jgi:hypothetical protein
MFLGLLKVLERVCIVAEHVQFSQKQAMFCSDQNILVSVEAYFECNSVDMLDANIW